MWLSDSSVGRKFIMAVTGAVLVLFVTFHCLMNAVAILWPVAYNSVCMFLGANWYALAASAGLALFILVHIIYAVVLTIQNRRARGHERYAINKRPAGVEWSSQNMLVLGIVILAFLVVHLIQFWAKMQLVEVLGCETEIPATAGTLFLQEAFSQWWTGVIYLIGFIALWFHLNHGFWSMFQSVGWDSTAWIPRLKCIAQWWVGIVTILFIAEAIVFTVRANEDYYKTNPDLQQQYMAMIIPEIFDDFGPDAVQQLSSMPADQLSQMADYQMMQLNQPQVKAAYGNNPDYMKQLNAFTHLQNFLNYLKGTPEAQEMPMEMMMQPGMPGAQPAVEEVQVQEQVTEQPAAQPEVEQPQGQPEEQPAAQSQEGANN